MRYRLRTRNPRSEISTAFYPLLIVTLFFLCAGGMLLAIGIPHWRYARMVRTWPSTKGVILRSGMDPCSRYCHPEVAYEYEVGGVVFTGENIYPPGMSLTLYQSAAIELLDDVRPGRKVKVLYDPLAPSSSCLSPGSGIEGLLPLFGAGLLVLSGYTFAKSYSLKRA